MRKNLFACASLLLATSLPSSLTLAAGPTLWYGVTHLGGTHYRYDYTVLNDSTAKVGGMTIDFVDSGSNPLPDYQNIADASSAAIQAAWVTQVGDSVGAGPAQSGYFDTSALTVTDAIAAGGSLSGFAAAFDWNAPGYPAAQQVTFYDSNGNTVNVINSTVALTLDTVTAANARQVDLSWTWSGPAGLMSGFRVERSTGTDLGPWNPIVTLADANATSYSDKTAAPSSTYYYRVVATSVSFDSPPSNAIPVTTPAAPDTDLDGIEDALDNCPNVSNPDQADSDHDGVGDACDGCPNDPQKIAPGRCGCGKAETDSDGDGVPDCVDNCPAVANPDQKDSVGDGVGDACRPAMPIDQTKPSDPTTQQPVTDQQQPTVAPRPVLCGAGTVGMTGLSLLALSLFRVAGRRRG
jgi:hypothetical protein